MPNRRMADARKTSLRQTPCGIIRIAALCDLCRYRHNVHWTAGPGRLDRGLERYHIDPTARALEELTAELGTVLLAMRLGLPLSEHLMENHAAYISSWSRLLTDTPSALMKASGQAQKAVDHLLAYSQPLVADQRAEAA